MISDDDVNMIVQLTAARDSSGLRTALARVLQEIYTRGYEQRHTDDENHLYGCTGCKLCGGPECSFVFSHTREWCGHNDCRKS